MSGGIRIWEAQGDYRAKATTGVALAAVMFLLPFTLSALISKLYVVALGGTYITAILVINTLLVARGHDHRPLTLYALVPGPVPPCSWRWHSVLTERSQAPGVSLPYWHATACWVGTRQWSRTW
jgi:hypothetical protein